VKGFYLLLCSIALRSLSLPFRDYCVTSMFIDVQESVKTYLYIFIHLYRIGDTTIVKSEVEVHTCPGIIRLCHPGM